MSLHEVLPVRTVMHSRGMARTSTCPRSGCGLPETVRHLLWECGVARDLWAATSPLQCPCLPAGEVQPTYQLVVSGVSRSANIIPATDFSALWLTINSVKAALWTSRNLLVGMRVTLPLPALRRLVTSTRQEVPCVANRRGGGRGSRRKVPSPPTAPGSRRVAGRGVGGGLRWGAPRLPCSSGRLGGAS